MKKITLLLSALTVVSALYAELPLPSKPVENLSQHLRVVNVCQLTNTELNEIMQGQRPEIAVEFLARTTLPIRFFLTGDLVHLVGEKQELGMVEIQQTFYGRCVPEGLIFSTNLMDWKPFQDFITGNASVALTVQDGQPSLSVGAETNHRS